MKPEICTNCDKALNEELAKFTFSALRDASPPKAKGVYIIRTVQIGRQVDSSLLAINEIFAIINWDQVSDFVIKKKLSKLNRIKDCQIIYIGSGGTYGASKNTLWHRYKELASRHTIMFPLWLLLYLGWEFEYGYYVCTEPNTMEAELKLKYKNCHNQQLPALVDK